MPKAATLNAEPKRGKPFEKGNPGGPGNPWAGRLQQYRKHFTELQHLKMSKPYLRP